jgi:hypothetical protein
VKLLLENWREYLDEGDEVIEEKDDACTRKVKARYKVWPSAYASGALVQCRKVGAANWGNKSKKESVDPLEEKSDFSKEEEEGLHGWCLRAISSPTWKKPSWRMEQPSV